MGNIYLVGFMGCGKTTVGRVMANRLGLPFIDLDEVISERFGASIQEVFARHGEQAFRREESDSLQLLAEDGDAVVATGGGCFCEERNREIITAAGGRSVYLEVPWPLIRQRLPGSNSERPRFGDATSAHELYQQREPWYRMASVTVTVSAEQTPEQVAGRALEALAEVECGT